MSERLFDPKTTAPKRCTSCGARDGRDCRHDRELADGWLRASAARPKTCLKRHDPATAPLPEGF